MGAQIHEDYITPENKDFIKEIVHDRFGPPSIIKGVQTYKTNISIDSKNEGTQEIAKDQQQWTVTTRRTGLIAKKIGQYPLWLKDGTKIRTTLLQVSL